MNVYRAKIVCVRKPQVFTKEVNYFEISSSSDTSLGAYDPRGLRPSVPTTLGAYGTRGVSGEEPPFSVINSYLIHTQALFSCKCPSSERNIKTMFFTIRNVKLTLLG